MCLSISSVHCAAFVNFLHMNVRDCLLTDYEQTLRRLDATDCFGRKMASQVLGHCGRRRFPEKTVDATG